MAEREWILLNPGPANTSRSVREALVMPDLCHREPEFFEMMRECRERLVRLAGCAAGGYPYLRVSRVQHGNAHAPGYGGRGRRVSGQLVRAGRGGRTVTPEVDR
jgi:hypothetical protein